MSWRLKDFLDALKQPASFLATLCLLGLVILFLPEKWARPFGFVQLRTTHREWVGIPTVAFGIFALLGFATKVWICVRDHNENARAKQAVRELLFGLSEPERVLLAYAIFKGTSTLHIGVSNPTALALGQKGLLQPAAGPVDLLNDAPHPHVIPLVMWNFIRENADAVLNDETFDEFGPAFRDYEQYLMDMMRPRGRPIVWNSNTIYCFEE